MSCSLARNRVQRTSLNVYDPDIFNCSRHGQIVAVREHNAKKSRRPDGRPPALAGGKSTDRDSSSDALGSAPRDA